MSIQEDSITSNNNIAVSWAAGTLDSYFSFAGNMLIVITISRGNLKQSLASTLIANLAVTDLMFSLQNVVFSPVPLIIGR